MQPNESDDSYISIILSSFKSPAFWSIVCGVIGTLSVIAGGAINLAFDELARLALWVLLAGTVLIFLAIILSPRAIAIFLSGRRGRYGANVAIMTVSFFVILLLVNFLMYRTPTRIDVTSTRVFTLSPQTIQILKDLDTPVRANAFFVTTRSNEEAKRQQTADLLNEFARRSGNFTYRFIDPELNRSQAVKYGVVDYPTIVFESIETETLQAVSNFQEQEFVTGILVATGTQQKKIFYLTGHGEAINTRDNMLNTTEDFGLDYAIEGMQRDNYRVSPLNLKQFNQIPVETATLVIAGPEKDLDEEEYNILSNYINEGGHILALLDPDTPENFNGLFAQYGAYVTNLKIADAVSNVGGELLMPMVQKANGQYFTSVQTNIGITDQLDVTFFPDAGAVKNILSDEDMPPHIQIKPLAFTTPASWLETNPDSPGIDESDELGPFTVAAVIETSGSIVENPSNVSNPALAKIVIISDSDFATNKYFHSSDNANLFLNSVNWLAEDYDLISIRPKLIPYRELIVNTRERNFIKWSSWVFPPSVMIFLGIFVWWRRR